MFWNSQFQRVYLSFFKLFSLQRDTFFSNQLNEIHFNRFTNATRNASARCSHVLVNFMLYFLDSAVYNVKYFCLFKT